MMKYMGLAFLMICFACTPVEEQRGSLVSTVKDGVITGSYYPTHWDGESIRKNVGSNYCPSKKSKNYSETKEADGRITFTATCI
jgi:hypothetical protein